MTKHVTFAAVATQAQAMVKTGSALWSTFVLFTMDACKDAFKQGKEDEGKALKAILKENEDGYKTAKDTNLNTIGAYRSTKSVIVAAARYGVAITDSKGEPLGKTEVEKAIKDLRVTEPTIETIKRSFTAIGNKMGSIDQKTDAAVVYSLAKQTLEQATRVAEKLMSIKSPAKVDEQVQKMLAKQPISTELLSQEGKAEGGGTKKAA